MRSLAFAKRLAISIASLAALVGLIAGVPLLLAFVAGWPLPDTVPSLTQIGHALGHDALSDSVLIKVIALVGWAAWLQVVFSVALELAAWARGHPAEHLKVAGPFQPAVRALIASAALILSSPAARPAAATPLRPQIAHVTTHQATAPTTATDTAVVVPVVEAVAAESSYTVVPGDTLWDIAGGHLGDPFRWHEIYDLNRGKIQPDAHALENPNLILPGWALTLPGDAIGHTDSSPNAQTAPAASAPDAAPSEPAKPAALPNQTPQSVAPPASAPKTTDAPRAAPVESGNTHASRQPTHDDPSTSPIIPLVVFGSGIAAASVIALLTRLRLVQRRRRRPGRRPRAPTPHLEQIERKLRQSADLDRAEFLDLALRAFASGATDVDTSVPEVLACRVAQAQVELLLADPPGRPPKGFESTADERGWVTSPAFSAGDLRALAAGTPAPLPSLVSLGTLEEEELLIDIESAGVLTVSGDPDRAVGLVRAVLVQLATSMWIDHVDVIVVADEAAVATAGVARVRHIRDINDAVDELSLTAESFSEELRFAACNRTLTARLREQHDGWVPTILVCDAEVDELTLQRLLSITGSGGRGVGVVTRSERHARWHAEIDGDGLLLSPLGFRIRPNLIDAGVGQALEELLRDAAVDDLDASDETEPVDSRPSMILGAPYEDADFEIEVRVLGTMEIAGLAEPIRRPKCVELAAYLALHPQGVSDERLKTAIWAETAATLSNFNTIVSTTRVQLGYASDGTHHLPRYQVSGQLYRIGPLVTTDVARFEARVAHSRQSSPEDAIVTLRSALDLVRGQPFETTRGFEWAFSEGFVASAEATVADAAHTLAQLYLEAGDTIGATWAAVQGLKAAPGDETLYRDRMLAYDLAGNPAGVERVMDELCEVVEALEPYDTLHPETLTLYERISHRKRVRTQT